MPDHASNLLDLRHLSPGSCEVSSAQDEIRVDQLCVALIKTFAADLAQGSGTDPIAVGRCCQGVDYFLREFVIADRHDNLMRITGSDVRRFAGHWYIVKNMDPNMPELTQILEGVAVFYRFLADRNLLGSDQAEGIEAACRERDFYARRIEDFWAIEGDGFLRWRDEIPL